MDNHGILESLLFTAGDEGLDEKQLLEILDMSKDQLVELIENYSSHGLMIQRFGMTYVLTTKKEAATYIEQLIEQKSQMKQWKYYQLLLITSHYQEVILN